MPAKKIDQVVRDLVPTRVRILVQARPPQIKGRKTNYAPIAGYSIVVPVRNITEFRRLWMAIEQTVARESWCDRQGDEAVQQQLIETAPLDTTLAAHTDHEDLRAILRHIEGMSLEYAKRKESEEPFPNVHHTPVHPTTGASTPE